MGKTKEPVLDLAKDTDLKDMDPEYVECKRSSTLLEIYAHCQLEEDLGHDVLCIKSGAEDVINAMRECRVIPVQVIHEAPERFKVIHYCTMFAWTAKFGHYDRLIGLVCQNGDKKGIADAKKKMDARANAV